MSYKILILDLRYYQLPNLQDCDEREWGMVNNFTISDSQSFIDRLDDIYEKFKKTEYWNNLKQYNKIINKKEQFILTKEKLKEIIIDCENKLNKNLLSYSKNYNHSTRENNIYHYLEETTSDFDYRFSIHKIKLD